MVFKSDSGDTFPFNDVRLIYSIRHKHYTRMLKPLRALTASEQPFINHERAQSDLINNPVLFKSQKFPRRPDS